jgi:hypothetical protein
MAADLNHHHRVTLEKIFSHPLSGNVEWRQVLSLVEAVGTTTQEPQRQGQGRARRRDPGPATARRQGPRPTANRRPTPHAHRRRPRTELAGHSPPLPRRGQRVAVRHTQLRAPAGVPVGAPRGRDWPVALATGGCERRPTPTMLVVALPRGPMDFSAKLDDRQQRAAHAKAAAQAAVSESREQLRQRIDRAKVDVDLAATDARQDASAAADEVAAGGPSSRRTPPPGWTTSTKPGSTSGPTTSTPRWPPAMPTELRTTPPRRSTTP